MLHESGDASEIVGATSADEEASHCRAHQRPRLASSGGAGGVQCGELLPCDLRRRGGEIELVRVCCGNTHAARRTLTSRDDPRRRFWLRPKEGVAHLVVRAAKRPAVWARPEAAHNAELLLQHLRTYWHLRKREAVAAMLRLVPSGAEPCMHAASRHLLHRGDHLRVLAWVTEGHWAHQRPKRNRSGLTGESRQNTPGVACCLVCGAREGFIVISAIEGIEAE